MIKQIMRRAVAEGDVELLEDRLDDCKVKSPSYLSTFYGELLVIVAWKKLTSICNDLFDGITPCENEGAVDDLSASSFSKEDKAFFDLGFIVEKKWIEAVKSLLKRRLIGLSVQQLAHFVVKSGDTELYSLIREKMELFNVNGKDDKGLTPLDYAVQNKDIEAVRLLCEYKPIMDSELFSRNCEKLQSEEIIEVIRYWSVVET